MIPRILQLLPCLESGGVEQVTLEMAYFLKNFDSITPTFVASCGGKLVGQLEAFSGVHFSLPIHSKNPLTQLLNIQRIISLIKGFNIQLVHARSRAPAWSALAACKIRKVPFVTTYHGIYNSNQRIKDFYNSVMARGDKVIAISHFVAEHILSTYPNHYKNVEVIPEGIDTIAFDPKKIGLASIKSFREKLKIKEHQVLILLPGRLTRWKGQKVLLQAAQHLDADKFVILFLGDDQGRKDYLQELKQIAKKTKISIHFMKNYNPIAVAYMASDLILSCSTDPEAFGRITAEALSLGRPFIGTRHGATLELTKNGEIGDLIPPNDPQALVGAIQRFQNYPDSFLNARAINARQYILNHYSHTLMAQKTLQLYKKLIEAKS